MVAGSLTSQGMVWAAPVAEGPIADQATPASSQAGPVTGAQSKLSEVATR